MLLSNNIIGSDIWWNNQKKYGIPNIKCYKNNICIVTFFWKDPQGNENYSKIKRVWINIIGITDHHQNLTPKSLFRIPNTNVWYIKIKLLSSWCGSYFFIPDIKTDSFKENANINERRQWWSKKFFLSQIDKFNKVNTWMSGRGIEMSYIHLPHAPYQSIWKSIKKNTSTPIVLLKKITWISKILKNKRSIWIYNTDNKNIKIKLMAILLDGNFWIKNMPIIDPIKQLTDNKEIPSAVYIMVDNIDRNYRNKELTCNLNFWLAIKEELLPLLKTYIDISQKVVSTLIIGQSFGGLSAVYAVLNWPKIFMHAISISGSFWWPTYNDPKNSFLLKKLKEKNQFFIKSSSIFYIETGIYENLILKSNKILKKYLKESGYKVKYKLFNGGHDAICWRSSLLRGIKFIWNTIL